MLYFSVLFTFFVVFILLLNVLSFVLKVLKIFRKKSLKIAISGGTSPIMSNLGVDASPPPVAPGGDARGRYYLLRSLKIQKNVKSQALAHTGIVRNVLGPAPRGAITKKERGGPAIGSEAYEEASARSGRSSTIGIMLKSYEPGGAEEGIWPAWGRPATPGTPGGDAPAGIDPRQHLLSNTRRPAAKRYVLPLRPPPPSLA